MIALHRYRISAFLLSLAVASCSEGDFHAFTGKGLSKDPVVYGNDDRQDYYAYSDGTRADLLLDAAVVLMSPSAIDATDPDDVQISASTLGDAVGLCEGERFANQLTAGFCSGTLIAPDLVLTAGHCIEDQSDCDSTRFVFKYAMADATNLLTITSADVFECSEVVVQEHTSTIDYAIARLDRDATGHTPVPVRYYSSALANDDPLLVAGFPTGLPLKIDDGGVVRDSRASQLDYFIANLDTFGGNSGSGVYLQSTGELVGVLNRGDTDYVPSGNCYIVNVCPDDGCGGEDSTYAFHAVADLCATTGSVLCACGDGTCDTAGGETTVTCPDDCGTSCGDGACNGAETPIDCPQDCGTCPNTTCEPAEAADGSCCSDCGCSGTDVCLDNICYADPSAGSDCSDPYIINSTGTQTLAGETTTALDSFSGSCVGASASDRVYNFNLTDTTLVDAMSTGFDTGLHLRSTCDDAGSELACNDDSAPPGRYGSRITETLPAGTYFLIVDGYGATSSGDYTLTVTFSCADADRDGTCDADDGCLTDPNKTEPGVCGCGVADDDTDGDGTADCNDNCPNDPSKTEPGLCGCGVAEGSCADNCPDDPDKTGPGRCGCGVPEGACSDGPIGAGCACSAGNNVAGGPSLTWLGLGAWLVSLRRRRRETRP